MFDRVEKAGFQKHGRLVQSQDAEGPVFGFVLCVRELKEHWGDFHIVYSSMKKGTASSQRSCDPYTNTTREETSAEQISQCSKLESHQTGKVSEWLWPDTDAIQYSQEHSNTREHTPGQKRIFLWFSHTG